MSRKGVVAGGLVLAAAFLLVFESGVRACGTKIARGTCGIRYHRLHASLNPSTILFFQRPEAKIAPQALVPSFEKTLEAVGHKVQMVDDPDKVGPALESGKFDIVVADLADAEEVERQVRSASPSSIVVPIAPAQPDARADEAMRHYTHVIWSESGMTERLRVIEETAATLKE